MKNEFNLNEEEEGEWGKKWFLGIYIYSFNLIGVGNYVLFSTSTNCTIVSLSNFTFVERISMRVDFNNGFHYFRFVYFFLSSLSIKRFMIVFSYLDRTFSFFTFYFFFNCNNDVMKTFSVTRNDTFEKNNMDDPDIEEMEKIFNFYIM